MHRKSIGVNMRFLGTLVASMMQERHKMTSQQAASQPIEDMDKEIAALRRRLPGGTPRHMREQMRFRSSRNWKDPANSKDGVLGDLRADGQAPLRRGRQAEEVERKRAFRSYEQEVPDIVSIWSRNEDARQQPRLR